jgi:hypothetical protein
MGVAVLGALLTRAVDRDMPVCSDDREQGQARSHAITQRAHLHVSPAGKAMQAKLRSKGTACTMQCGGPGVGR